MILKNKKIFAGLMILVVLIGGIILRGNKPQIDQNTIQKSAFLPYPPQYNFRQTKNDCGPFNVAAVVRILKNENVDSVSFAEEIGWRLPNKYTLPWGLEKQLKENGINVEKPHFSLLTNDEKIMLIQQYLSLKKPVIILGERDNYEHYLTILGFNAKNDEYYIYDSLKTASPEQQDVTTDENNSIPGNVTLNSRELLDFWRGGGMYGLWKWYGLIASLRTTIDLPYRSK